MGESFDRRRVDEADRVAGLMKKERERFAVSAGRFQAGVAWPDTLL